MDTVRSRMNDARLTPQQRRRAVIQLLAVGLGRMVDPNNTAEPAEKSSENEQNSLAFSSEIRLSMSIGSRR